MKIQMAKRHLYIVSTLALAIAAPLQTVAHAQTDAPAAPETNAPATKTAWGHTSPDIKGDISIRYGVLANGMKYALQKNETPKGSASVRFRINVGSIAEADNEQGLAHFLEHMAFNGSKNVPEGEMVKILERQGLSFGADTNAYTSFDETVYQLDLPKTDDKTVDTALLLMRETGSELTIAKAAVERERGVVLSEKQFRNSPQLRQIEQQFKSNFPNTPFGKRFPIGTEEVLKTAPAERVKAFYQRYYRPENATLVIVGDFDVDAVEAKIKSKFSDWKGVGEAGAPMNRGTIDFARPTVINTFNDPAISNTVEVEIYRPYVRKDGSLEKSKLDLTKALASAIVGRRFSKLAQEKGAKVVGGGLSLSPIFEILEQTSLSVIPQEGDWKEGLAAGEQELRRALQYGFTQAELDEAIATLDTLLRDAEAQANTRPSALLADAIFRTVSDKSIVTTPKTDLETYEAIKPALTLNAVNDYFRKAFAALPNVITVVTKTPIENPQAAIFAALQESSSVAVTAPVTEKTKAFAYDNFGKSGKVAKDKSIVDLGIRTITFANNVRLSIKKTDFETGQVHYGLRFGNGLLTVGQDKGSLPIFMSNMMSVGGLKAHSFDELQTILAGKKATPGLGVSADSFGTSGVTTPTDFALQMKLLAAYMTQAGYRSEADTVWQNNVKIFSINLDSLPQAVAGTQVPRILASGDTRFGIGTGEELAARNIGEVKAILDPIANSAPIEIAIVGDIDEAAAIKAVADSFGALPKRQLASPVSASARAVSFPKDRSTVMLTHKGKADQGMLQAYWPTTDNKDQKADIIRELTAEVLGSLLLDEVREKLGATYSPQAFSDSSDNFTGYGFLGTSIIAAPDKMDEISSAIKRVAKMMRDAPVDEDVLLRARKPIQERLQKQERENGAWLGLVNIAQSEPEKLDRRRKRDGIFAAVTVADIQAAAQQYLKDGEELEIRIVPKPAQ
jgi:zinc protease